MSAELDCQQCGACCVNLPVNRAEGFVYWVEIEEGDAILERADLVRKLVMHDADGVPHLRIADDDGRCLALRGTLGEGVSCGIYHHRPSPCRRVQPGDEWCLRARHDHGLAR